MRKMSDKNRARLAAELLAVLYPDAACSLEYNGDGWRLLIMGRLSAQCTDERVNIVCRELFTKYPTPESLAGAPLSDIENIIMSCGLYHVKAKNIIEESRKLAYEYGGVLPDTMKELLSFDGVGRKIANLVLGDVYHNGGIVADTHCIRICGRLGFYDEEMSNPLKVERTMTPLLPSELHSDFCHRIVHFGREWCTARSPKCDACPLGDICKHKGKLDKNENVKTKE